MIGSSPPTRPSLSLPLTTIIDRSLQNILIEGSSLEEIPILFFRGSEVQHHISHMIREDAGACIRVRRASIQKCVCQMIGHVFTFHHIGLADVDIFPLADDSYTIICTMPAQYVADEVYVHCRLFCDS